MVRAFIMGEQLLQKFLPYLDNVEWSGEPAANAQGRQAYIVGLDKVEASGGEPKALAEAIRVFQSGDSLPYAYAGVAYILLAASEERDGSYAPLGLEAAMGWLEKAQALEPDIVDINVIEAFVYVYNGRYDDALLVIDFLYGLEPMNYHVHLATVAFWEAQKDLPQIELAIAEAAKAAATLPQKFRLTNRLGDLYMQFDQLDKALAAYKENAHFDPKNPLLWHKISLVYWRLDDLDEAERANQQSLRLGALPAAQKMAEQLKERKKQETGRFGGLFK
jgi:tetratricopeptide (TPR) repeat protein